MTEKMSRAYLEEHYDLRRTHQGREQLIDFAAQNPKNNNNQQGRANDSTPTEQTGWTPRGPSNTHKPAGSKPANRGEIYVKPASRVRRNLLVAGAVGSVLALGAGGGVAYSSNFLGLHDLLNGRDGSQTAADTYNVNTTEAKGERGLLPDTCIGEKAVSLVITFDAQVNLVPQLASDKNPTPTNVLPYLNKEAIKNYSESDKKALAPFLTDGYNRATLQKMSMGALICEAVGAKPITTTTDKDGHVKVTGIDRTGFTVTVEDPNILSDGKIIIQKAWQKAGKDVPGLDPSKAEYYTLPFPGNNLLFGPSAAQQKDVAFMKSFKALNDAMATPLQQQSIMAGLEIGAIKAIDANGTVLRDEIDAAVLNRLGAKDEGIDKQGNYTTNVVAGIDQQTKKSLTIDSTIGLDKQQQVTVSNVHFTLGSLDLSKITSPASPSPTATPTPTDAP